MSQFPWEALLTQWSNDIIEAGEYRSELPPDVVAVGWLGYPGATEEQIAAAEAQDIHIAVGPEVLTRDRSKEGELPGATNV